MLYLATTIASWILVSMSSKAITSRLKEEGYDIHKKEKPKAEARLDKVKVIFFMLLPVVNIAFAGFMAFAFDKTYNIVKKSWLKEGKISKLEEKVESEEKTTVDIDLHSNEINQPRKYSTLSTEEKLRVLEEEKTSLLREQNDSSYPYNDKGAYTKKRGT